MKWKFWQKIAQREEISGTGEIKLAKPKELPDRVGRHLVTKLSLDPDWVWNLKCVMRPRGDERKVFDIRIFNPVTTAGKGVSVSNFNSLDGYPDMILFHGSYNKDTGSVEIEKMLEKVA